MSCAGRTFNGGCHCGRYGYVIEVPEHAEEMPELIFNTDRIHVITMATPLAAFLRVPLDWYHTRLFPRHADETEHMIRRRYMHGSDAQRIFCGFCGTPVTYWSPEGPRDSDYINVTLGSLDNEDIHDLELMGLVPTLEGDEEVERGNHTSASDGETNLTISKDASSTLDSAMELFIRQFSEIPWFDALVDGSILGKITRKNKRKPGKVAVQWEVIEWPDSGLESDEAERGEPSDSAL